LTEDTGVAPPEAELLRLGLRTWRSALTGVVLMLVLVAAGFSAYAASARHLWLWASLALVVYAIQAATLLATERRHADGRVPPRWAAANLCIGAAAGTLWGSLAWWLPGDSPALQLMAGLACVTVLLGTATATTSARYFVANLLPVAMLVPAAMAWHAQLPWAGGVSLVLILLVFRHGITHRRGLIAGIRQRQQVDALAEQLRLQQLELQAAERERTILNERQRLLRDLHDGVGASLISALKMIEHGRLSLDDAATVLRECLDELRLVVDSLEPLEHDLVTLLASLRYRLGGRLERAGIAIDWQMGEVPPLPWLDARAALEVLRILQELLSNILKHARATRVRISVNLDAPPATAAMAVFWV
jgi:signal transduction histidine kinase